MDAFAWTQLLLWPAVVAGVSGIYALRRYATVPGLVVTAAVCFGLFALWQVLGASYYMQLVSVTGAPAPLPWGLAVYLGITGALAVAAAWYGWRWRERLYPRRP